MYIHTISIGLPERHTDERGEWESAIFRKPVAGLIPLTERGHAGDDVANHKVHGHPTQAVCCQPIEHYDFWNAEFPGAALGPSSVGENWTISEGNEQTVCVGDVYRVGAPRGGVARVQVTSPRVPCTKQERKLQLDGFLKRVRKTRRTGWYLRVLTPGEVAAGDELILESRPEHAHTLEALNVNWHGKYDRASTEELLAAPEVEEEWKEMLRWRMAQHDR